MLKSWFTWIENKLKKTDWPKFGWIVAGFATAWVAMVEVVPPQLFKWVAGILGFLSILIPYLSRSGKWVETRQDNGVKP